MNVEPHDFTKPERLSAAWQRRLNDWCRLAFEQANKGWAKQLPFAVTASLLEVEVCYAQRRLEQLPEDAAGYLVAIAEPALPSLLVLPRGTLQHLVGAMLGDTEAVTRDGEMTLIEENVAEYFLSHSWLPFFRETWPSETPVRWALQSRVANPRNSRLFTANEVLIAINWQLRGSWGETKGTWLFPKQGLAAALGAGLEGTTPALPEAVIAARREEIVGALPVVVEIVVGTAELKLSQLSQLQVGDVVLLDQRREEGILARTGSRDLFRGQAGRLGAWKAFQVEALGEK